MPGEPMFPVQISVIQLLDMPELYDRYANKTATPRSCPKRNLGDEFLSREGRQPDGFCPRAWNAIQDKVRLLAVGNDSPWTNRPGVDIVCCPDALHPVIYMLERIQSQ